MNEYTKNIVPRKKIKGSLSLHGKTADFVAWSHFDIGKLCNSHGVANKFDAEEIATALKCHLEADWDDICKMDSQTSNDTPSNGGSIFTTFTRLSDGERLWIITEADLSVTTMLLPNEY